MFAQPEFQSVNSGLSTEAQVNQIYLNLFGRQGDSAGLLFWTQQISSGRMALASIANDLIFAATNGGAASATDRTALTNKTNTALSYTADIRTTTGALLAYQPQSTNPWVSGSNFATAVSFMNTATATNAPTTAQIAGSVSTIAANGAPGQTITLTTDRFSYIGGTANDTFNAGLTVGGAQTLLSADTIDGGGGNNRLNAEINASATPASIQNVQTIQATFSGANNALVLDLSNATGVTSFINTGSTNGATVSGLSLTTALTQQSLSAAQNFTYNFAGASGTSDTAALTVSGIPAGTVTIANIETLNLTSSGSTTNTLTGLAAAALTTLNVGGTAGLTITNALTNVTTVAQPVGGSLSGALNLKFDQGAVTATGGAGNDTFQVNAAGNANLTGGVGNDTFIFAAGAFSAADTVTGGDGTTDTLQVDAAGAAVANTNITGVEILAVSTAVGATLNTGGVTSGINTVNLLGGTAAGGTTVTGPAGTLTLNLGSSTAGATLGDAFTVNDTGVATTDVLNLNNANAATNALASKNLVFGGYETVNLGTGTGSTNTAQLVGTITVNPDGVGTGVLNITGANSLGTADANTGAINATTINASGLTGTAALVMGNGTVSATSITGAGNADRLVASAVGTLIDAGAGADTVIGGVGNDTLRGGAGNDSITAGTGNDTIDGGEGDDRILLEGNLTANDTVDGGAGTNTAVITAAVATAAIGARLSNIQTLETSAAAQDMSVFGNTTITTIAESGAALAVTNAGATLNTFNVLDAAPDVINSSFRRATDTSTNALTINAGGTVGANSTLRVDDEETITLNTATFAVDLDLTNAVDLTSLTITGSGSTATAINVSALGATNLASVSFSGINTTRAVVVDASASTVALTLTAGEFAGTYTTGSGSDSVTGGSLADVITTGNGADTVNSGAGNDNVSTGAGIDVINVGAGSDTVDAGGGGDAITLTVDGATDQIRQAPTTSVAASATSFENANVAVGDSLTFGNGVDVVNNFLAGAGVGTDQLEVLVGAAVPTSLIGQVVTDLSAGNAVFYASGSFNASTGRFTIAANGSGADTMIIQSAGAGASDNLTTNASGVVLVGVRSSDLVAGNFLAVATAYLVTQPSVVSSATGAITSGAVSAQNLLNLGFTSISGGVIGDANTLTIDGEAGTQTFNSATGVFTGATNAAVNQLLYQAVDTVNLDVGNDTYTTASLAAGTTTVNAGTGVDILAFTAASTTAAVNLGTSTVVTGFENIDASLNTVALNATLVADSTSYVTSANGDTVNFANAAGNAVAVNAAANTEPRTLTFTGGDATDVVTTAAVKFDIAAAALGSDLVVNAIDAVDNAFTITTGTANTTVNNGVAGDVITVAAAAAADGRLVSIAGASQYNVTGLNADLTSAATAAVTVTSASTTAQTLTNTGTGLITANAATIADNAVLTVAGAGAGGFALTNVSADVLSTATGAVAVTSAAVANQTVTNSGAGAATINAAALADNTALTVAGTNAGGTTVNGLIANISSTAAGLVTVNASDVADLSAANTGAGAVALNATALADNRQLITNGTGQFDVTGLLADLTNTSTGATTATLRGTAGADGVTVTSTTAITVNNGTFVAADTLTLAGVGVKTVGSVATGFVGQVALDATNIAVGSTITIGGTANTVTQANGAASFTVNAVNLEQNALLTVGGAGTAGSTATITNLVGDVTLNGNGSFASITLGDAADNGITVTTGTANSTVTGGAATDALTVNSNVADNSTLTLSNNAAAKTVNTLSADLVNSGLGIVTATLANVGNNTITSAGTVIVNNGAYVAGNVLSLVGNGDYTVGVAAGGQQFLGNLTVAAAGTGAINIVAGNVNGVQTVNSAQNIAGINVAAYTGANDTLRLNGAGTKAVTTGTNAFTIDTSVAGSGAITVDATALAAGAGGLLTLTDTGVVGPLVTVSLDDANITSTNKAGDVTITNAGATASDVTYALGTGTTRISFNSATLTAVDAITKQDAGTVLFTLTGNTAVANVFTGFVNVNSITVGNTTSNVTYTTEDNDYALAGTYTFNAQSLTTGALAFSAAAENTANVIFTVTGGAGDDLIVGAGGNDTLVGGAGSDTLRGGVGNDTINGDANNDQIEGGLGNDALNGGTGSDTFTIAANGYGLSAATGAGTTNYVDTITGFTRADDSLAFSAGELLSGGNNTARTLSRVNGTSVDANAAIVAATVAINANVDLTATNTTNYVKFSSVTSTSFASAIGTGNLTVAGLDYAADGISEGLLASYYDSANGRAVFGYILDSAGANAITNGDTFVNVSFLEMSAADYTAGVTINNFVA
jgi:hypothetical protein